MVIKHIDVWNNIFVNFHRTENLKEDEKTRKNAMFLIEKLVIIKMLKTTPVKLETFQ